jgi:hypothetical protein
MKQSGPIGKALVLGALMGGVLSLTPACGMRPPVVRCNADNCAGCCDENAQCFTGLSNQQCGSAGASCGPCTAGQTCTAVSSAMDGGTAPGGRCLSGGTTGGGAAGGATAGGSGGGTAGGATGGGTGGGAASCNAQNCPNGCCTAQGTCQNPPTTARCGMGGAACMACPSKNSCVSGACQPCSGCVDLATGRCETGTMTDKCGRMGDFCANCGVSNGTCMNQVCVGGMSGCNPSNCATGCCDQGSGNCIEPAAQTGMQCGQGTPASLCIQCGSNQCDTDAGVCVGGSGGGGAGGGFGGGLPSLDGGFPLPGGCGPGMPCPSGQCCTQFGLCVGNGMGLPPLLVLCGPNGGTCATCSFGQSCNMTTGMCM